MANSLKASFVLLLITMTVGMSYAYAEQQANVVLPYDDNYVNVTCWTQVSQGGGVGEILYHCIWNWFIQPDTATEIERIMEADEDPVLDELFIKDLVNKNPLIIPVVEEIPEEDIEPDVDIPIEPLEPLTAEDPDRCTNRGSQPAGLKCQVFGQPAPIGVWATEVCPLSMYEQHILKNWESITYGDIRQLQCDNFLYIYQHKIGTDEFPQWLNHCVPKVVRNN